MKVALKDRELFVEYCRIWHGDHDEKWQEEFYDEDDDSENKECGVYEALNKYDGTKEAFEKLLDAFMSEDDDRSSWEYFLKEEKEKISKE